MTYKLIDDDLNPVATCNSVRDAVTLAKDIASGRRASSNRQTCIRVERLKGRDPEYVRFIVAHDNGEVVSYNLEKIRVFIKKVSQYVLKSMIKRGVATDVAILDADEYQEVCSSGKTIAVSTGVYGVNGVLVESNGKWYASVGRNTRTLSVM